MGKLTKAQVEALISLAVTSPRAAYPGLSIGSLNALERRGFVSRNANHPGAFFSPRTVIQWRITDAGRRALAEHEGEG